MRRPARNREAGQGQEHKPEQAENGVVCTIVRSRQKNGNLPIALRNFQAYI